MKMKSVILLGPALLLSSVLFAQVPSGPATTPTPTLAPGPLSDKDVLSELKTSGAAQLLKDLTARGVDFEMNADLEKKLRKAKATDDVIKAVTAAGPKERAAAEKAKAVAGGKLDLSPGESADFKAIETELDPDRAISLAEAFVKKYPQSQVNSYVEAFEANAYQTKGDAEKLVEYADKSVELKKDNLMSLLLLAYAIPQPQYIKKHQAEEEKELTKAEGYAQDAFKAVDSLQKPAEESDADFAKRKANYNASIHADMGMIHLERAQLGLMSLDQDELIKSEKEFKVAVSTADHPDAADYYRLGDALRLQGKIDDAIAAFTKCSDLSQGVLKQYAVQQLDRLKKEKANSAAPAKP
jgi:tetratricopeptide (TPR) repeat protein